jgi:uncharacterized protein YggE
MKGLSLILSVILLTGCNAEKDYKTILLKTSGIVEVAPDEASISLNLSCVDKNIEQAKTCLLTISSRLNEDLVKFKIRKEDILTTNVNLNKDYVWINNSNIFNGYLASTTTRVKIRDLTVLDDVYTKLLSNENLTIGSLTYNHSKLDSINEVAYLLALENANKLADKILSRLPEKNKAITRISNFEITRSEINPESGFRNLEKSVVQEQSQLTVNIGNMIAEKALYVEFKIY